MTKQSAIRRGRKLASLMTTKGWKVRVWENMGWHYDLHNGPVSLTEHVMPTGQAPWYSCLIDSTGDGHAGLAIWTDLHAYDLVSSRNPNTCVQAALDYARDAVNSLDAALKRAEKAVKQ